MFGIDDIGSAIVSAGSDIIGSAVSAREAGMNRDMNREEARLNREWQERMSNTQYQRAMEDARKAGLNPILTVANQGGAGVPSGAQGASGAMPDIKTNGLNFKQTLENIALTKSSSAKNTADTIKAVAEAKNTETDTSLKSEVINQTKKQIDLLNQQIELAKKDNDWYKATKLVDMGTKIIGGAAGIAFGTNQGINAARAIKEWMFPKGKIGFRPLYK